jgi:molybdopterin-containing oxidoreductase family molybdopterin binding subunit
MPEREKSGLSRRTFLKTTALAAGSTALANSILAGCTSIDRTLPGATGEEKTGWGRCYHGGCFACRYKVTVRDGIVARITPDPEEPYGRRPCLRGYSQIQRLYAPDRIRYPMKRAGERGENKWERITWDEAIQTIAEKWTQLIADYGSHSIASYGGSPGARFLSLSTTRLAMMLELTTFDMSADWAIYTGLHYVYGAASASTMSTPSNEPMEPDFENAKTIILWGHNLSEAYIQRWRYVMQAQRNGTKLISVDPNETLTGLRSDKWYALRPASDTALMLSMCQCIIQENLHDTEYLKSITVGPFLVKDSDGTYLRMSDLGVQPVEGPPDPATGIPTIIDPHLVWDEASEGPVPYTSAVSPALEGAREIQGIEVTTAFDLLKRHLQDYVPEKVAETVDMTAEEIRELAHYAVDGPVAHMFGLGWQAYDNGLQIGMALATLVAVTGQTGKPGSGIVAAAQDFPMNAMWLFPTFTFTNSISVLDVQDVIANEQFAGAPYPAIRSILLIGGGLVGGIVNMNNMIENIIKKQELFVCMDVAFSDSARWADIVLPASLTFEQEDIYISPICREVQLIPKHIDPLYECKTQTDFARMLGAAMGLEDFSNYTDEEALRELLAVEPLISMGITLEALREQGDIRYAPPTLAGEAGSFPTATGKVEFYVEEPAQRIFTGAEIDVPENRLAHFYPPLEAWPDSPTASKYPFILMSERARNRWHSSNFNCLWLNELEPEPTLRMNPEDAASRGIADGDYVECFNDRGSAVAKAVLSAGIRPNCLAYPKGMQSHQYASGNFAMLTHNRYDPLAINSSFFDCGVDIRKWEV